MKPEHRVDARKSRGRRARLRGSTSRPYHGAQPAPQRVHRGRDKHGRGGTRYHRPIIDCPRYWSRRWRVRPANSADLVSTRGKVRAAVAEFDWPLAVLHGRWPGNNYRFQAIVLSGWWRFIGATGADERRNEANGGGTVVR